MNSKSNNTKEIKGKYKLSNFPEEVDMETSVKIYGETSYENQNEGRKLFGQRISD